MAVVLRGVTLVQLRVCWKCQHARTLFIFQKEQTAPFFSFLLLFLFLHLHFLRKKKKKKVQTENPLFVSSTVPLARYLQLGIKIRSRAILEHQFKPTQKCRAKLGLRSATQFKMTTEHVVQEIL